MKKNGHRDIGDFVLMVLLKDEPLTYEDLERRFLILASHFELTAKLMIGSIFRIRSESVAERGTQTKEGMAGWDRQFEKHHDVRAECEKLVEQGVVRLDENGLYTLTTEGKAKAENVTEEMERTAGTFRRNFLNPAATARNTFIIDFFLATMKLLVGFISGSVGLIGDGADAGIDTMSAIIVWLGVKYKREVVGTVIILAMMYISGVSVAYESVLSIVQSLSGQARLVSLPLLVIIVEVFALLFAVILTYYQRAVGRRYGSFALISQSIDSKNHIYVALAVISGAVCSLFGIHFVDALIGAGVAFKIIKDAIGLTSEVVSSIHGQEADLSKYKMPFEERWHLTKRETGKMWILYALKQNRLQKDQIIDFLNRTLKP
ncbi:MAG: cation transporter, partial [candidate division WOR-3 bacterium]